MKQILSILLLLIALKTTAQQTMVYEDKTYRPEIKSVQFFPLGKESTFPIINLRTNEQLMLAFDDLSGKSKNLTYTIEHCDAQWNSSNLSPAEYLQSFTDDRITDYRYSSNTKQKYIHYELIFPNQNIIPKISGNYLLKVYEDSDPGKPLITKRMYVIGSRVSAIADVQPSPTTQMRETNQKVNFQIDYTGLNVQNPYNDIKVLVMQNARPLTAIINTKPSQIRGNLLIYNDVTTNDFPGGNEFRHFDTRSLRLRSERIGNIYRDTANTVMLLTDYPRDKPNYTFQYDNDGKFFITNQDYSTDSRTDADYAHMYFNLAANKTDKEGAPYIVGQFNNYRIDAGSKLDFDKQSNRFYTSLFLKQGVYDFQYVWVDVSGKADETLLEGSHFETENDYQMLIYYRPVSARWDELVGYRLLNTGKK